MHDKYKGPNRRKDNPGEMSEIIREAVYETLSLLGIDTSQPFELQQDMAFIRAFRKSWGDIKKTAVITSVTTITSGFLYIFYKMKGD